MIAHKQSESRKDGSLPSRHTLTTKRLSLRLPRLDDADAIALHLNSFAIARMLTSPPFPYDRQDALEWLLPRASGVLSGWSFMICLADGSVAGSISIDRSGDSWVLGYWLAEDYWGQGLMGEAAEAVASTFFTDAPDEPLLASVLSDNPRSFRLLASLGFRVTGAKEAFSRPRGEMKTLIETRLDAANLKRRL